MTSHQSSFASLATRLIVMLASLACPLTAAITFSGLMIVGDSVYVILIDSTSGRSSGWIRYGDTFERHKVSRYDRREEQLIVEFDKRELVLRLTGSPKSGDHSTVVRAEGKEFHIFSDTKEQDGDRLIFRGKVTGLSDGAYFSCDEVIVSSDSLMLAGSLLFHRPGTVLRAERLRIPR